MGRSLPSTAPLTSCAVAAFLPRAAVVVAVASFRTRSRIFRLMRRRRSKELPRRHRRRLLLHPHPHLFCSAAAAVWDLVVRRAWKEGREERASRNIFAKDGFWCARLGNRRLEHGIASTVGKWRRRRTTRDERTASHRSTSRGRRLGEFSAKFPSCRRHTDPCCTCPNNLTRGPFLCIGGGPYLSQFIDDTSTFVYSRLQVPSLSNNSV